MDGLEKMDGYLCNLLSETFGAFKSLLGHAPSYLPFTSHKFLLGAGSDQQPWAPSTNHLPDVRHWMEMLLAHRSGIEIEIESVSL